MKKKAKELRGISAGGDVPVVCIGDLCVKAARPGNQYCSDECEDSMWDDDDGDDRCASCGRYAGGHSSECTTKNGYYTGLQAVFARALSQSRDGKGNERHACKGEKFEEQIIVRLGHWLGSNHFEIGQAVKKAVESVRLPKDRAVAELLGAMVYLAAAVVVLETEVGKK